MIDHLHKPDRGSDISEVVALVRAEMLRLLGARRWRQKRHAFKDGFHLRLVVPVRPGDHQANWYACCLGEKMPFGAALAAIGGVRAGGLPAQRGFCDTSVEGLPLEIEPDVGVVFEQACAGLSSRALRTRRPGATLGSDRERSRTPPARAAAHSIEDPCATRRRSQRTLFGSA